MSDRSSDVCSADLTREASSSFSSARLLARAAVSASAAQALRSDVQVIAAATSSLVTSPVTIFDSSSPSCRFCASIARGLASSYAARSRSEEHTSELQSLMRISYAVFCLKKKIYNNYHTHYTYT